MFSNAKKIIGLCFFFLCLSLSLPAYASGIAHLKVGEELSLVEESNNNGDFKWILKQGQEVVSTQTGRSFKYIFKEEWMYEVVLSFSNAQKVKNSKVRVYVGDNYLIPLPWAKTITGGSGAISGNEPTQGVKAVLKTLPPLNADGKIHLTGTEAPVIFFSAFSEGKINEYRLDNNINYDTSGDGIKDNDIDNLNDPSLITGANFTINYKKSWGKITAALTVLNQFNEQDRATAEIVFDEAGTKPAGAPLEAKLLVLPEANLQDKKVHLQGDEGKVVFYSKDSSGDVSEYRIDRNIYADSNGNGNNADDIDNLTDPSFHTGDFFETVYKKTEGRAAAQLTVVGRDGKGSLIQQEIIFDENLPSKELTFYASKTEVFAGEKVKFQIANAPAQAQFAWDFDGDSKIDLQTADTLAEFVYPQAGDYLATLQVTDGKKVIQLKQKIVVKTKWPNQEIATQAPLVDFSYTQTGAQIKFTNQSGVDPNLKNREFRSNWDFGDGETSTDKAPVHLFKTEGTYKIILEVTDSVGKKNSKIAMLEVKKTGIVETQSGAIAQSGAVMIPWGGGQETSLLWKILKIIFYTLLGIIGFVIALLGGYLIYLKIQDPDLTFAEIIEAQKEKFFGAEIMWAGTEPKILATEEPAIVESSKTAEAATSATSEISQEEAKANVPAWLRKAKENFGAVESSAIETEAQIIQKDQTDEEINKTEENAQTSENTIPEASAATADVSATEDSAVTANSGKAKFIEEQKDQTPVITEQKEKEEEQVPTITEQEELTSAQPAESSIKNQKEQQPAQSGNSLITSADTPATLTETPPPTPNPGTAEDGIPDWLRP